MRSVEEFRQCFSALSEHLGDAEIVALLPALTRTKRTPGEAVTVQDQRADTLHLVLYGALTIHLDQGGERLALGQAGPGSIVGEVAFIEPGPASANIEALDEAITLDLPRERFDELAAEEPAAASALLHALSHVMASRLRTSSRGLLRRVADHRWMSVQAHEDRPGWIARIGRLLGGQSGRAGGEA